VQNRRRLARSGGAVEFHAARAEDLPLADASFDVAVSTLMLHHLPTRAKQGMLQEAYRVLASEGRILIADLGALARPRVPWWLRLIEHAEYLEDHVCGRIPLLLTEAGFVNVRRLQRRWPAVEYWAGQKP
jgi:ubiquinone/menaquinone biosynthesis C-methylase UbiE